jgi:hypothetical protein
MEAIPAAVVLSAVAIRDAQQLLAQQKYADAIPKLTGACALFGCPQ